MLVKALFSDSIVTRLRLERQLSQPGTIVDIDAAPEAFLAVVGICVCQGAKLGSPGAPQFWVLAWNGLAAGGHARMM